MGLLREFAWCDAGMKGAEFDGLESNRTPTSHAVAMGPAAPIPSLPATSLKPKEHGAYAILVVPLLSAMAAIGPSAVSLCIAAAAVTGFLAHEPLLVAVGHRGSRAQRNSPGAIKRTLLLQGTMTACGFSAMVLGDQRVRIALLACALLAILNFMVAVAGQQRTLAGQLAGVIGLSLPSLPVLIAGGVETSLAAEAWIAWFIGFSATTMAVRGVIAAQKRQSRLFHWIALSILCAVAFLATLALHYRLMIATTPMLILSVLLLWSPPPARYLKGVGWTLVGGTAATAVWMTAAL